MQRQILLSQQQSKNKWFEDDIHDDEYSPDDIDDMVRDKTHVQLGYTDNMQTKLSVLVSGLEPGFENVDIQLEDSMMTNNYKMASIAQKFGVY